jgi:hypothetical protein
MLLIQLRDWLALKNISVKISQNRQLDKAGHKQFKRDMQ